MISYSIHPNAAHLKYSEESEQLKTTQLIGAQVDWRAHYAEQRISLIPE